MFGLSTWELLIIVAVALIFVGPDQLPKVARTIGKGMRQVRGAMGKVDDEMRKAVREVSAELDDDGHPLREAPYRSPMAPIEPVAEPHAPPPGEPAPTPTPKTETASATPEPAPNGGVQAVQDPVNPNVPSVEVQSSRRGANRTMAERDWSEVGKQPIPGRVAQGTLEAPAAMPPEFRIAGSASPPGETESPTPASTAGTTPETTSGPLEKPPA